MKSTRQSSRALKLEMARRIATRLWAPGALIPGEEVLAREFGAARATVNRALQELARDGLVERRRKAGTRVVEHPVREARFSIPLVEEEIRRSGAAYGYRLIARETADAPAATAERLGLAGGQPLLHIRCLHLADHRPYQYEDRWILPDTVPAIAAESFESAGPNAWLVANAPFSEAEFAFTAGEAAAQEAEWLALAPGTAVFVAERTTWLLKKPITHVRMVHPPTHRMVTRL